jgi:hypothetical protein
MNILKLILLSLLFNKYQSSTIYQNLLYTKISNKKFIKFKNFLSFKKLFTTKLKTPYDLWFYKDDNSSIFKLFFIFDI